MQQSQALVFKILDGRSFRRSAEVEHGNGVGFGRVFDFKMRISGFSGFIFLGHQYV